MGDDSYVYTQIYRYSERFRVKIKDQHIIVDLFYYELHYLFATKGVRFISGT